MHPIANLSSKISTVAILSWVVSACTILPASPLKLETRALPPATTGVLEEVTEQLATEHGVEHSSLLAIKSNRDALQWRLMLVDEARSSIDVQYFIWGADAAARLLFDRLMRAADRGVRVRMLVDDLLIGRSSRTLALISAHPNFELRLFNPGRIRGSRIGRTAEMLLYFRELNRRMHNKLFVVDGRMAIVGGRNVGASYFGVSEKYNFRDLDVLVAGEVVPELARAFDEYWNSPESYPTASMSPDATFDDLQSALVRMRKVLDREGGKLAAFPREPAPWADELRQLPRRMRMAEAHFIQDRPADDDGQAPRLYDMLTRMSEPSQSEILISTPYLIPVDGFLESLARRTAEGVRAKILTGSLSSNNHTAAHSHYRKYRRQILAAGVELYEFRHDPGDPVRSISDTPPVRSDFISLHTKALVADRRQCFIGSLNLDPRAMEINTENGLYIESPEFCGDLAEHLEALMHPDNAWRVYLDRHDRLAWRSSAGTTAVQPARNVWQRVVDFFFRLLPIESQL